MPTKILVWNIRRFSLPKLDDNGPLTVCYDIMGNIRRLARNTDLNRNYILSNIALQDPDIFAVVEVQTSQGDVGTLIDGNGKAGCLLLLALLRAMHPAWCLVPPRKLVSKIQFDQGGGISKEGQYTEGIAVFFRSDRLAFTGPCVWPTDCPEIIAEPQAYPDEWMNALYVVPAGQPSYAGQCRFNGANGELFFPNNDHRRPFFTKFREQAPPNRTISLVTVHFPPNADAILQAQAVSKLTTYFSETYRIGDDEILLIAGDYNLDYLKLRTPEYFFYTAQAYQYLLEKGFVPLFNPKWTPYGTMLLSTPEAVPDVYRGDSGLDNIAVKWGAGLVPNANDILVVDRVTDTGDHSLLVDPLAWIKSLAVADVNWSNRVFRSIENFGCQYATSDHLAITVTV